VTEQVLLTAVNDKYLRVRVAAYATPNATEQVLLVASRDRDMQVHRAATRNRQPT